MKIPIDKTLRDYLDEAVWSPRPRRNKRSASQQAVLAKFLADAEAAGDAMRYLDARGRIAWRATPRLREHLADLEADARADNEHEAI